jgi:LytS/YehU family sensor histidine kinase
LQVESELKALRAQMDPHFIFNALSSMRKELLQGNTDKADAYIVRFSRLLRLILDTTRTPSVRLTDNIELLHLYIQIEQSRHAKSFAYRIHLGKGVHPDEIYVPGMVLQPLVENAIIHGLFHRQDGKGKLYIGFSKTTDVLKIKVSDNGVGRKMSGAAKETGHRSHATSIIRETLELMWKGNLKEQYFNIKDKVNTNGEPTGTEVVVMLPLK